MKFYTKQHDYYCGIDLHTKVMYLCIQDSNGNVVLHQNMKAKPANLTKAIKPFLSNLVIAVECLPGIGYQIIALKTIFSSF